MEIKPSVDGRLLEQTILHLSVEKEKCKYVTQQSFPKFCYTPCLMSLQILQVLSAPDYMKTELLCISKCCDGQHQ